MRSVRSEAPYLPSNVEFVAKNNGGWVGAGVGCLPPLPGCGACRSGSVPARLPACFPLATRSAAAAARAHRVAPAPAPEPPTTGLEGDPIEAVRKVLFEASYMVMVRPGPRARRGAAGRSRRPGPACAAGRARRCHAGGTRFVQRPGLPISQPRSPPQGLGDVYLGAPCAVPVDPRHRLVVPKYNPARTYTPEGGVGIGGTYMCIVRAGAGAGAGKRRCAGSGAGGGGSWTRTAGPAARLPSGPLPTHPLPHPSPAHPAVPHGLAGRLPAGGPHAAHLERLHPHRALHPRQALAAAQLRPGGPAATAGAGGEGGGAGGRLGLAARVARGAGQVGGLGWRRELQGGAAPRLLTLPALLLTLSARLAQQVKFYEVPEGDLERLRTDFR